MSEVTLAADSTSRYFIIPLSKPTIPSFSFLTNVMLEYTNIFLYSFSLFAAG
jgi:hypothetical protein